MISFRQFVGGTYVGSTISAPLVGVQQGSVLLAFLQVTNVVVNSITDSQGNVWTISENQHPVEVGSPFNIVSAWAIAKASGACTVAWNMSAAGGGVAFAGAAEYATSNSWPANPVTAHAYRDCNAGNPNTVGAMVAAKVGSMIVLWGALYTTGCVWSAITAGFNLRTGGGGGSVEGLCDAVGTSGSSNSPQMNLSVNQNSFALGFVLDEIAPTKILSASANQIQFPGFTIEPIEEE